LPPLLIIEEIILQIGVAADYPHVSEDLKQHAGGAARSARAPQLFNQGPYRLTEEPDNDFSVRKGGIVIWDLSNPRSRLHVHLWLSIQGEAAYCNPNKSMGLENITIELINNERLHFTSTYRFRFLPKG
jgi:hypothetical protein